MKIKNLLCPLKYFSTDEDREKFISNKTKEIKEINGKFGVIACGTGKVTYTNPLEM